MKKFLTLLVLSSIFCMAACSSEETYQPLDGNGMANTVEASPESQQNISETQTADPDPVPVDATASANLPDNLAAASNPAHSSAMKPADSDSTHSTTVSQGGPYGKISLQVPSGWNTECCPIDSTPMSYGCSYGIRISPQDVSEGYIEIAYIDAFGVCGTGLETESASIAGCTAEIGTYDRRSYWDYIAFNGPLKNLVATSCMVTASNWSSDQRDQVLEILDTLTYNPDDREGGAYIYTTDSESEILGLHFYLHHITPTGATIVFQQYDPTAKADNLEYGDDFILERKEGTQWVSVPFTVDGDYGFHDIAYPIAKDSITERELNWEWLYGSLESGSYRIRKKVTSLRNTGDYDSYELFASFILFS